MIYIAFTVKVIISQSICAVELTNMIIVTLL